VFSWIEQYIGDNNVSRSWVVCIPPRKFWSVLVHFYFSVVGTSCAFIFCQGLHSESLNRKRSPRLQPGTATSCAQLKMARSLLLCRSPDCSFRLKEFDHLGNGLTVLQWVSPFLHQWCEIPSLTTTDEHHVAVATVVSWNTDWSHIDVDMQLETSVTQYLLITRLNFQRIQIYIKTLPSLNPSSEHPWLRNLAICLWISAKRQKRNAQAAPCLTGSFQSSAMPNNSPCNSFDITARLHLFMSWKGDVVVLHFYKSGRT
jgi:hypothetical protein